MRVSQSPTQRPLNGGLSTLPIRTGVTLLSQGAHRDRPIVLLARLDNVVAVALKSVPLDVQFASAVRPEPASSHSARVTAYENARPSVVFKSHCLHREAAATYRAYRRAAGAWVTASRSARPICRRAVPKSTYSRTPKRIMSVDEDE